MSLNFVPNSPQIQNPNPNFSAISQCSSPNPPQITPTNPNWLLLPDDVWFSILSRLYTCDILENAKNVCKLFRKICIQPSMFRVINMLLADEDKELSFDVDAMTRFAVDCSDGGLVDAYLEYCDDETLMYIVQRSKNLKHLRIGKHIHISEDVLVEAVQNLPVLEEVEIIICDFSAETIEDLGHACPSLKSFSLNNVGSRRDSFSDEDAFAIAESMPNLRRLQLIGNCLSNSGLTAILNGCPLLESLDLRACFNVDLYGALHQRCAKIKHLRLPYDSTADYAHQACTDGEYTSDESSLNDDEKFDREMMEFYETNGYSMDDDIAVPQEYVEQHMDLDDFSMDIDHGVDGSDDYSNYYFECDCFCCSDSD